MAQFKDLPNEVVIMIAESVLPGDIENFSATTKNVRLLCERSLRKHYELKRKYRESYCMVKGSDLSDLVHDIALEPDIALHIECLTLQYDWYNDPDSSLKHLTREKMMSLGGVVARSMPPDHSSAWVTAIESGDEDPILAILLLQLRNVATLKLSYVMVTYQLVFQTLTRILETPGVPHLSNLTTLEVYPQGSDPDRSPNWHAINIFAKLPSLQSVIAWNLWIEDHDDDRDYLLHPRSSNVSSLMFTQISISAQRLYEFLRGFRELKKFSYRDTYRDEHLFETFWIRAALLTYARASLEYLSLTRIYTNEKSYMGSLRDFENLKKISTELDFLIDWSRPGRLVLAQMLPASIEEVCLYQDRFDDPESFHDMIISTAKDKPKLLPRLKQLHFIFYSDKIDGPSDSMRIFEMEKTCRDAGFELLMDGERVFRRKDHVCDVAID